MVEAGHVIRAGHLAAGLILSLVALGPRPAEGQGRIIVRDELGVPVPYATITVSGGNPVIADDSGRAPIRGVKGDSIDLQVRRIGFREYRGWHRLVPDGEILVTLPPVVRELGEVVVTARLQTPLAQRGFYDRVARVQRGAIVGDFITPEMLALQIPSTASRALTGTRYVRIGRGPRGQPMLLGRGGCGMTLIVDGQRVAGMIEESITGEVPTSINSRGRQSNGGGMGMDIDTAVDGGSIMAIEVYPSTANAPAELQSLGGRGSCGIVAIWTGPRR